MSLHLKNPNESPPGYWQYDIPELPAPHNHVGPCTNKTDLLTLAWQRYQANAILPPTDLADKVEEQMCRRLGSNLCEDEQAPKPPSLSIRAGDVIRGTRILVEATLQRFTGGNPRVSLEEANLRANICTNYDGKGTACPEHKPVSGCAPCVAGLFFAFITRLSGGQKTAYDDKLGGCMVCGCALKGKVWIKQDLLLKAMSPEQLQRFPPHCWLIKNLETKPVNTYG